jgi:SPRY domain
MEGAIYFEINIAKDCKGFKVGVTKTIDFDV